MSTCQHQRSKARAFWVFHHWTRSYIFPCMESHLPDTPLLRNESEESWWPKGSQPMTLDPVLLTWDFWGLPGLSHSFAKLCRAQQALKIYTPNTSLSVVVLVSLLKARTDQFRPSWDACKDLHFSCGNTGSSGGKDILLTCHTKRYWFPLIAVFLYVPCITLPFDKYLWMASSYTNHLETTFTEVSNLILLLLWMFWGGF